MEINTVVGMAAGANSKLADIAQYAEGKLLASITVQNAKWTGEQISIDKATNIITIENHGLVNGNCVAFVPLLNNLTGIPTGIIPGVVYYVVGVNGNDFQVSSTSGGTVIDITTAGTNTTFQVEKLNVSVINAVGLSLDSCTIVFKGCLSSTLAAGMNQAFRVNNVSDELYYYGTSSAFVRLSGIKTYFHASHRQLKQFFTAKLIARNNSITASVLQSSYAGVTDAAPTTFVGGTGFSTITDTVPNEVFSKITEINWGAGVNMPTANFLLDDSTLEVYS